MGDAARYSEDDAEDDDAEDDVESEALYRVQGSLREWVVRDEVQRFLAAKFRHFLRTFKNPQTGQGEEYLLHAHTVLAVWLADAPAPILELLDRAAYGVAARLFPALPDMEDVLHVRIANLPIVDQIRNIRQTHLQTLVRVGGVVTRRSGVFPQLQQARYDCAKCRAVLGPFFVHAGGQDVKLNACPDCQSKGPFTVNVEQTIYRNYQRLSLQESPGSVPAGRLPRHKEVVLLHDLIDCARPGEEIVGTLQTCKK